MISRIRILSLIASLLALAACSRLEQPAAATRKIVINYPNVSGSQWPLFLAKDAGYYSKYGLDVELKFAVHPNGVAMLASGEAQMVNSSLEQLMQAASKDSSMALIGSSLNRGTFALMATKGISNVQGLKGKRVAVSQIGDAPYGYVIAILSQAGLTSRDVEWIPVGQGVSGRAAALTGGRADATLLTAPAYFRLEEQGYSTLVNLAEREDIFASTVYMTTKPALQADPKLGEDLIKAHAEAIKRFYDDRAAAVKAYLAFDPEAKAPDVERIYDIYLKTNALERIPYVLASAAKAVLDQQADPQVAAQLRAFDFKQVIDNSIVDRLVQQGFFRQTFGDSIRAEEERKASLAFGK